MKNKEFNLSEKQEIQVFITTALEIFRDKKEFNLAKELIKKIKRLKDLEFEEFIRKLKAGLFNTEREFSKKIRGYDFNNGYSSSCHDTRIKIDKLVGDEFI